MKTENTNIRITSGNKVITSIIAVTGAALCLLLTSCIIPVEDTRGSRVYTTYEPGYRTTSLPSGYRTENISGRTYYYHDGSYYRRDSNGYIIADAPHESRYYSDYDRLSRDQKKNHTYVR